MKQRIISAIVLIAIAIPLFLIGGMIFKASMALLATLAYKETLGLKKSHQPYPTYVMVLGLLCLELIVLGKSADFGVTFLAISLSVLALAIPSIFDKKARYTTKEYFYLLGFILFLGIFFNLTTTICLENKWVLLYLLIVACVTDSLAFITGKLIGKHKLIPEVSPGKTIEGSLGGTIVGAAISSIFYYNVITPEINIFLLICMSLVLSVLGQLGDLFFSKIKRENEIKDFSNIIPGHGGILDRFDSLSFIVLGYIIIVSILNIIK